MNEPDVEPQSQIDALRQEIQGLKSSVASLQKEKQILINGIKRLLDQVQ
jgi:polyhydroxyalkanoate synthesis regulator phasin